MNIPAKLCALVISAATLIGCQSGTKDITWVDYGGNAMAHPDFMTDMAAAGALGEEHERLAKLAGTWNVAGKFWMVPGEPPMETTGKSEIRMILGGRFLAEDYTSNFAGMPFNGFLIQGYDNIKKQNFTIWMDNMSTGAGVSYGNRSEDGVVHTSMRQFDIMTPTTGRPMRMEITENGPNKVTLHMFDTLPDGGEHLSMEMVYTR